MYNMRERELVCVKDNNYNAQSGVLLEMFKVYILYVQVYVQGNGCVCIDLQLGECVRHMCCLE